ncbi:MAG: hypothetical protein V7641_2907 [Blastocatellia bacterium]
MACSIRPAGHLAGRPSDHPGRLADRLGRPDRLAGHPVDRLADHLGHPAGRPVDCHLGRLVDRLGRLAGMPNCLYLYLLTWMFSLVRNLCLTGTRPALLIALLSKLQCAYRYLSVYPVTQMPKCFSLGSGYIRLLSRIRPGLASGLLFLLLRQECRTMRLV